MKADFSEAELQTARQIIADLCGQRPVEGIQRLQALKDAMYASIPDAQRISRGITWVVERLSLLLAQAAESDAVIWESARILSARLEKGDLLQGAPIFLMAEYGQGAPEPVLPFFEVAAGGSNWVVREFAAQAFRKVLVPNKALVHGWLVRLAQAPDPNLRRFTAETLRPAALNRWLYGEPEYSLSVLRCMFREPQAYPRTAVGNNLSDLSRRLPELIYSVVGELVEADDPNSAWIAYRACRNLVKKEPERVMDLLGVQAYHYKDRNFIRS